MPVSFILDFAVGFTTVTFAIYHFKLYLSAVVAKLKAEARSTNAYAASEESRLKANIESDARTAALYANQIASDVKTDAVKVIDVLKTYVAKVEEKL